MNVEKERRAKPQTPRSSLHFCDDDEEELARKLEKKEAVIMKYVVCVSHKPLTTCFGIFCWV